jgi:hypothetical protein
MVVNPCCAQKRTNDLASKSGLAIFFTSITEYIDASGLETIIPGNTSLKVDVSVLSIFP